MNIDEVFLCFFVLERNLKTLFSIYRFGNITQDLIYLIYPRINLNSTFEEPGINPVFHFILFSVIILLFHVRLILATALHLLK
jgi:hypothetical protein